MADEQDKSQKTEDPTQKRLEEARKKGDVAKSQDVPIWFLMMATAGIMAAAGPLAAMIADPLVRIMDHPHAFRLSDGGAQKLVASLLASLATPMLVIFAIISIAGVLGHVVQSRPLWTGEKIKPELSKLSPMKGLQRMFGMQGWVNLLKSIAKMAAIAGAMMYAVWPEATAISEAGRLDPSGLLAMTQVIAGRLLLAAVVVVGVIAAMDFIYQRWSFMQRMRMSRQDVKDEVKQQEGDPHVRARLRQIRLERSRKRMMQNVPKSTVVITNPTHYSVALRYDPEKDAAPVCMAKGADEVALRIRELAKEHNIPIVENVPLARALFASVEIEESVPREHFEAVAKVIGFVMNTAKGRKR
ncbi:MAG TPA: flagellar biosynthesis protein FlhB [Hyphomonadaceae bacterium]|nr:flagellar biosynthesis protein FlhB [Hyphomonadaceae bacterium]